MGHWRGLPTLVDRVPETALMVHYFRRRTRGPRRYRGGRQRPRSCTAAVSDVKTNGRAKSEQRRVLGFGSSDCNCASHLFRFDNRPTVATPTGAAHTGFLLPRRRKPSVAVGEPILEKRLTMRVSQVIALLLLIILSAQARGQALLGQVVFSRRVYRQQGRSYQQIWSWNPSTGELKALTHSLRDHYAPVCKDGRILFDVPQPWPKGPKLWSFDPATGQRRS
jgi:hypothetical protein